MSYFTSKPKKKLWRYCQKMFFCQTLRSIEADYFKKSLKVLITGFLSYGLKIIS